MLIVSQQRATFSVLPSAYPASHNHLRNLTTENRGMFWYIKMLKEADIKEERKAPILLPDYRGKAVLARMIDIF